MVDVIWMPVGQGAEASRCHAFSMRPFSQGSMSGPPYCLRFTKIGSNFAEDRLTLARFNLGWLTEGKDYSGTVCRLILIKGSVLGFVYFGSP